ncbi:MAG: single-stranded-DNA-specific exonuclease RecJ [Bacteroidota bacterium]
MPKRWRLLPESTEAARQLAGALGIAPLVAQLLIHRGLAEPGLAQRFLHPDLAHLHPPSLLPNLDAGVARLIKAFQEGERLLIYGDYDVDGVTSVSLLMRLFKPLARGQIYYQVPKRLEDGYGLSLESVRRAAQQGIKVILTVDCGISAVAEVAAAREMGLDVIVTDHHQPGPVLPEAAAVIDPKLPGSRYPFTELAGVGVAFKLGQALVERGLLARQELLRHLDLVALGTVADVVPLIDENRILAHFGLAQLNRTELPGLRALLEVTRLDGREITSGQVGFVLAPRLNASGRLGDASAGIRLLLTADLERGREIARALERENQERQRIEAVVLGEALQLIKERVDLDRERAIVLGAQGWHPGVIGIVASRLIETFHRPTILIAFDGDVGRGSGRSIPGFNLHWGLSQCAEHLERFGGHEAAAGLEIRWERLEGFARAFGEVARAAIPATALEPTLRVEGQIGLPEATLALAKEIARLAPYGQGNPMPVLACRGAKVLDCRGVGENSRHLKVKVAHGGVVREGIGFNLGAILPEIAAVNEVDLAFVVEQNTFNGATDVQLNLRDLACAARVEDRDASGSGSS